MLHDTFKPLVPPSAEGMSRECIKFYSRSRELIANKRIMHKSTVMGWLPVKLSFIFLWSVNIYIQGWRSRNIKEKISSNGISNNKKNKYELSIDTHNFQEQKRTKPWNRFFMLFYLVWVLLILKLSVITENFEVLIRMQSKWKSYFVIIELKFGVTVKTWKNNSWS